MEVGMDIDHPSTNLNDAPLAVYAGRLENIFAGMDRSYDKAAAHYGFQCSGCENNCCLTRFYHHTYLEYLFIRKGFGRLDLSEKLAIQARAEAVCRQTELSDRQGMSVQLMCPLNRDGLCTLYHYRPMICRLHGIPHELQKPGQPVAYGPGCGAFDERCSDKPYFKFDRTPFYRQMAGLERELRQAAGLTGRIKLTIAEMVMRIGQSA
jgi:hypothetical protein